MKITMMSLLLLVFVLSGNIATATAANQLPTAYCLLATTSVQTLVVEEQGAKPDFPHGVDFTLRARGVKAQRATLNYSLVGDPITAGVQAKMAGPTDKVDVAVTLDLTTNYIPPGTEVSYYWSLLDGSGKEVATPAKTFTVEDKRHRWQSLTDSRKRVSVHWYEGDTAFGRNLRDTAAAGLDRIEREIGAGLERPADVWVYASQDELIDALPANIPEWVGGKAFPSLGLVMAVIADDEYGDSEAKRIIPHELSHLVLYQATRNPYNSPPAWLDEGIAVHNQESHDPGEEQALQEAAEEGRLVPVKALSGSFGADETTAQLSYAQGRSVVEFILNDKRYGAEKLARTVGAFREGVTYDEALQAGLGVTVDELDSQWRASLPYEIAPPGRAATPQAPSNSQSQPPIGGSRGLASTLPLIAILAGAGFFALLFIAGAVLTVVMLARRRAN